MLFHKTTPNKRQLLLSEGDRLRSGSQQLALLQGNTWRQNQNAQTMQYKQPFTRILFLCMLLSLGFPGQSQEKMQLITDYENANGEFIYQNKKQNSFALTPELKNGDRLKVWFNVKLTGYRKDTTLTMHLPYAESSSFAPDPLLVKDHGKWKRIPAVDFSFYKTYRMSPISDTLQIAAGIPYTYSRLNEFLKDFAQKPHVEAHVLTKSEAGRYVPFVQITNPKKDKKRGALLFIGRQHAFEAPCSYFMEGLLTFMAGDHEAAEYLRRHYRIYAVPMVDVDQVYAGGTGKSQLPADINREWLDKPHWKAVKTMQQMAKGIDERYSLRLFMDIHSPFPITKRSSHYYTGYKKGTAKYKRLQAFFDRYSEKEGWDLIEVRNYRVKSGQMTARTYMDNPSWNQFKTPHFEDLLFSTTYEQSWQSKPGGTPYTIPQIFRSAENMGLTIQELLKQESE